MKRSSREIYDDLLVLRCQRQDLAAWDELVQRWNPRLHYYLRRMIDQEHDVVNALQEVWLQAFRGISSLRDDRRLAPWLYTITRRTACQHYRRDYGRHQVDTSEAIEDEPDELTDNFKQLENAELVHFGLSQLGLVEREALTLFFLEDLSIDEMAQILGIPSGTVKSRLSKARRDLRRILERESDRHET